MSFEPTLAINKQQLEKHKDILSTHHHKFMASKTEYEKVSNRAGSFLYDVVRNYKGCTLSGVTFFICKPELSKFNEEVRRLLGKLDVEFTITFDV